MRGGTYVVDFKLSTVHADTFQDLFDLDHESYDQDNPSSSQHA